MTTYSEKQIKDIEDTISKAKKMANNNYNTCRINYSLSGIINYMTSKYSLSEALHRLKNEYGVVLINNYLIVINEDDRFYLHMVECVLDRRMEFKYDGEKD